MALYNENTNTLVIANRGVNPFSRKDVIEAALPIVRGEETLQMAHAETYLVDAWREAVRCAQSRGLPPPKLILTGHSMGGTAAEVQLARVYADPKFAGVDVKAVTFAGLGADRIVGHVLSRGRKERAGFNQFAWERTINYYREGDGVTTNRAATGPDMPKRVGQDVMLAGIDMQSTLASEQALDAIEGIESIIARQETYGARYLTDHRLLSFYHADFLDPLGALFARRRRRPALR